MSPWVNAARPKTLSAGIVPVLVASALAAHDGAFRPLIFLAAMLGCIFIQVATNYINDGADFLRGADTHERLGPPRMAQMGVLSPKSLFIAAGICFFLALLCGTYLILQAGWPILAIGLVSIVCAIAYTAGPLPLAYLGLGDAFVLIFFGFVAVLGTYFSHTRNFGGEASALIALIVGFQGMSLICVNNTRDIPTDKKVGKKTMAVRMGRRASNFYYGFTQLLPFLFLTILAGFLRSYWFFVPALTLPLALKNSSEIFRAEGGAVFQHLLGNTAKLQMLFGLLLSAALLLAR